MVLQPKLLTQIPSLLCAGMFFTCKMWRTQYTRELQYGSSVMYKPMTKTTAGLSKCLSLSFRYWLVKIQRCTVCHGSCDNSMHGLLCHITHSPPTPLLYFSNSVLCLFPGKTVCSHCKHQGVSKVGGLSTAFVMQVTWSSCLGQTGVCITTSWIKLSFHKHIIGVDIYNK